jgi:ribose transport system substrate-binding protein
MAVGDAGKVGEIKFLAMDRNDDMLPFNEDGTIHGSVVQKSYTEMFTAVHLLYWLKNNVLKVVPDWQGAGLNILPERVETGVFTVTQANVGQFKRS